MKNPRFPLAVSAWAMVLAVFLSGTEVRPAAASSGRDLVSPDSIMASVRWLADDARGGRMTGSPGGNEAASWIARHFERFGLEPGGTGGSYLQALDPEVPVEIALPPENTLKITGAGNPGELVLEEDFVPFAFSENGTASGEIVFAGYGITAPDLEYDDYAGLDVEGKVVLVLRHEPQMKDKESRFNGTSLTNHSHFKVKAKNAKKHGAAGMILFTGPESRQYEDDELRRPEPLQRIGGTGVLAFHVKKEVGEALLELEDIDIQDWVKAVNEDLEPRSRELGPDVRAEMSVSMELVRTPASNVVAMLPGTDPGAGAVIFGAHYDHLGLGNSSSMAPDKIGEIHNGADDNASGTAALVELARVFSAEAPTRRTLVFAAFTGEELGLHGSLYMARSGTPVAMDDVQIMINMDMVGRPRDEMVTVGGMDSAAGLEEIVEQAAEGSRLEIQASSGPGGSGSDHDSFKWNGVPHLFFFSGLHEDYHRPSDDWNKIDRDGISEIVRIVHDAGLELANMDRRLEHREAVASSEQTPSRFLADPEDETLQPQSGGNPANPHGASANPHGAGGDEEDMPVRGYGPYLGTIPDMGITEFGVKLAGVSPGGPAEKAGLRGGDIVIRFDGLEIGDLYDYTDALRAHQPGDTVEIVVLRDGEELTLTATLEVRGD